MFINSVAGMLWTYMHPFIRGATKVHLKLHFLPMTVYETIQNLEKVDCVNSWLASLITWKGKWTLNAVSEC